MATERISTGGAALPLPRASGGVTGANTGTRAGELLTLRIESRDGVGANQVFQARSADGRLFQLGAGIVSGMSLTVGQTLQVQVPGAGSSQTPFQLVLQGGATLLAVPPSPTPESSAETAARLAFAQAQASTSDGDAGASSAAPDLAQLLAQRLFQGQGGGASDVLVLAQAWRELVLARLRQAPNFAYVPASSVRPGALPSDAGATALSLALLQAMTTDETRQDVALNASSLGATASQPHPASLLPQFWMFHAYAWNNTLPLTFWVLPWEEDEQGGEPPPRPANRARMLRLCFLHPVHGLLWVDVRVDEQHVAVDLHADQPDAVAALLQLRPAVSAALAQAGLRLLRYQVRVGSPRLQDDGGEAAPRGPTALAAASMNGLPALLNAPDTTLAPELFLAAVGVMEGLRTA